MVDGMGTADGVVVTARTAPGLSRGAVLGYSLGSLGSGVYSTVPTVLLLYYCTEVLRLPPATAATIVFLPKAWAILWDPVVGLWSDRHRSASGRRAPFILAGTVGVTLSFALLFSSPAMALGATVVYVMATYFLMASAYSLFAVPYVAVPAEISSLPAERERLMSWRMVFAMVGVLLGAGAAPHIVALAGGGRAGYATMGFSVAVVCGLAMLISYATIRKVHRDAPEAGGAARLRDLRTVLANRRFVLLLVAYLLAMSGAALFTSMVPYFVTHVLRLGEGESGTALFALLTGTLLSLPAWAWLQRRRQGRLLLTVAMLAYALVASGFRLLPTVLPPVAAWPMFFVLGLAFAGLQLLPFTELAHLAYEDARTGNRVEGLYTGIWTAGEKLALAIGPAAAALGLVLSGYVAGSSRQSSTAVDGLAWTLACGPALFLVPAMLVLRLRPIATGDAYSRA